MEKLETGTLDEVVTQREVLKVIRDLLKRPEQLRRERALLTQENEVE